jgi:NADH-quinone oxidoreductase subunit N
MLYIGILMMTAGLAFKISAAPFHFWAPDVYQGSPTVVTAFMSTIVKIAAFAAFFRLFSTCFATVSTQWTGVIQVLVVLTLLISNITAVFQDNVKRLLAYSSVAHAGYLLITLVALDERGSQVILFYVAAYAVATLGAFSVLHILSVDEKQIAIGDFNGLVKRNPFLAFVMTVSVLSLAGIPPLAGFFAKYMIFSLALQHGHFALVLLAVFTSLVGVYYYFQLIIAMYFEEATPVPVQVSVSMRLLLIILSLLSLALGIFPDLMSV